MKKFFLFVGARPNFMKAAPICRQMDINGINYEIYHSGQHYDTNLSTIFYEQLKLESIKNMGCANSNNIIQNIQNIIKRTKKILYEHYEEIEAVMVFGDVATTFAVSLAAKQLNLKLIHIESGLRSFDVSMPEELIRIAVDHISDILFAPSEDAVNNLYEEGYKDNVHMVGNVMIDCLIDFLPEIRKRVLNVPINRKYIVMTLHRPENVDDYSNLSAICYELSVLVKSYQIIFPVHPRTKRKMEEYGFFSRLLAHGVDIIEPMGYLDFIKLIMGATAVITDSGGIQEETTYLNIPCFTVRKNTERPVTITLGSNQLIDINQISIFVNSIRYKSGIIPDLWDGHSAERIIKILNESREK